MSLRRRTRNEKAKQKTIDQSVGSARALPKSKIATNKIIGARALSHRWQRLGEKVDLVCLV
jgi:hypothetical protein